MGYIDIQYAFTYHTTYVLIWNFFKKTPSCPYLLLSWFWDLKQTLLVLTLKVEQTKKAGEKRF